MKALDHKDIRTVKSEYSNKPVQQHEREWPLVMEWTHQQLRPCTPRHPNKYMKPVIPIYAYTQSKPIQPIYAYVASYLGHSVGGGEARRFLPNTMCECIARQDYLNSLSTHSTFPSPPSPPFTTPADQQRGPPGGEALPLHSLAGPRCSSVLCLHPSLHPTTCEASLQ